MSHSVDITIVFIIASRSTSVADESDTDMTEPTIFPSFVVIA